MVQIVVWDKDPFNRAIARFKRVVQHDGILGEVRKKKYFVSKPERRKLKHLAEMRRQRKRRRRNLED